MLLMLENKISITRGSVTNFIEIAKLQVKGECVGGLYRGSADLDADTTRSEWVVTKLVNVGQNGVTGVTMEVVYDNQ